MALAVTFSFDPLCPWTWRTSRWLVLVAPERDLDVRWHAFSLAILREEEPAGPLAASWAVLRLVEALQLEGRNDEAGRLYSLVGTAVHEEGQTFDLDLARRCADDAGLGDRVAALEDPSLDELVRAAHASAWAAAGPDIGSPVLELAGAPRGIHGPVLGAVPAIEESLAIWDAVATLAGSEAFFEVKRGRP